MEIPVRMNTTRPVSLCSLWGEGGVSQGLGGPRGAQAGDTSQTALQILAGGKWRDPPIVTWQGVGLSLV